MVCICTVVYLTQYNSLALSFPIRFKILGTNLLSLDRGGVNPAVMMMAANDSDEGNFKFSIYKSVIKKTSIYK